MIKVERFFLEIPDDDPPESKWMVVKKGTGMIVFSLLITIVGMLFYVGTRPFAFVIKLVLRKPALKRKLVEWNVQSTSLVGDFFEIIIESEISKLNSKRRKKIEKWRLRTKSP